MSSRRFLVGIILIVMFGLAIGGPVQAVAPEWKSVATRNPPLVVNWCSYGKFMVGWNILKLQNDASTTFDWFMVIVNFNSVPGVRACGSGYYHSKQYEKGWISAYSSGSYITEYGPTTTSGTATVAFTLGVSISASPGVNLGVTFGWSVPDIRVLDRSNLAIRQAAWYHDMVPSAGNYPKISDNSLYTQPAFVVRAQETDCLYIALRHQMAVGYWHWEGMYWHWHEYWSSSYTDYKYVC